MVRNFTFFLISFLLFIVNGKSSETETSEVIIDSLEQLIHTTTDLRDKGQYYLEVAEEREYLKQYAEAIIQVDQAIICAENIPNYNFMAQCLIRKAYIYANSSSDVKLRAKKIAPVIKQIEAIMDKVSLPLTRAQIYTLRGIQVEIEHDYDDSEEMFKKLIAFQKKAIEELELQQDTIEGLDLVNNRNYKKLEIASALNSWDRYDEALIYLDQVLSSEGSKSSRNTTLFVKMLGSQLLLETYVGQQKNGLINSAIDSTLFYCTQLPETSYDRYKINAYQLIHNVLYEIGDFEQAYKVQQQFSELRELDFNESEILAQGKAESNLKMVKDSINQAQILVDKNMKIEAKTNQNSWLTIGISISLIALVVVFFLLRQIRASKVVIELQNKQVNEALAEKGLLLKEVHHRVKNNMQLVSSLLELQSEFAKDEFSKKILSEGNDRIKALAFAHQNLYQNEDYENIELNDYFNQIIYHLLGQVNCKTTIDVPPNFVINIERGQVLGFIINELIMNSLKYAWKNPDAEKNISFSMGIHNNEIEFVYKDNGVGFPDDFSLTEIKSLGYTLIPSFVKRQLKGKVSCENENGAVIKITFPK
jgi:two-component sensor histidine kinase